MIKRLLPCLLGLLLMTVSSSSMFAQERGLAVTEVKDKSGAVIASFGASYALVIGESAYTNGWPSLVGVKDDVAAVKKLFEEQGFTVQTIQDAASKELTAGIAKFFDDYGYDKDNRLLVYFAGHGATRPLGSENRDMGYIVPTDAPSYHADEVGFKRKAIPMQQFDTWARQVDSRHVIFLFDSCFSGSIFATSRALPGIIDYKIANPVRQFISSGGANETVPDKSVFRRQLEAALRLGEGDVNQDGYVSASELGDFLQTTVVNYSNGTQHPQYGKIRDADLDKGDFVFLSGKPKPVPPVIPPTPVVIAAVAAPLAAGPKPSFGAVIAATGHLSITLASGGLISVAGMSSDVPAGTVPVNNLVVGATTVTVTYPDGKTETATPYVTADKITAVAFTYMPAPKPAPVAATVIALAPVSTTVAPTANPTPIPAVAAPAVPSATATAAALVASASAPSAVVNVTPIPAPAAASTPATKVPTTPAVVPPSANRGAAIRDEIFVQGGVFLMGDEKGDLPDYCRPVHEVRVSDFWMMKTEVTQKDYAALQFLWWNPSEFKGDDRPVENVSWYDAVAYANKLSERDKLRPAYTINGANVSCDWTANGWRLPTEAEWEFAARGGNASKGYSYSGSESVDAVAWYSGNYTGEHHPVGTKAANELGLYDMSGNVWEWCWDGFASYTSGTQTNPTGVASGTSRVIRGGSWYDGATYMRSAYRYYNSPDYRYNGIGFRVLRPIVR